MSKLVLYHLNFKETNATLFLVLCLYLFFNISINFIYLSASLLYFNSCSLYRFISFPFRKRVQRYGDFFHSPNFFATFF